MGGEENSEQVRKRPFLPNYFKVVLTAELLKRIKGEGNNWNSFNMEGREEGRIPKGFSPRSEVFLEEKMVLKSSL